MAEHYLYRYFERDHQRLFASCETPAGCGADAVFSFADSGLVDELASEAGTL